MKKKKYSESQVICIVIMIGIFIIVSIQVFDFFTNDKKVEERKQNAIIEASKKWTKNQVLEPNKNYYISVKDLVDKNYLSKKYQTGCVKLTNSDTQNYVYNNNACESIMDSLDYILYKNKSDSLKMIDNNYTYIGSNPNNYIMVSNNLYRIVKLDKYGIKAITNDVIEKRNWDSANNRKTELNSYCQKEEEGCNAYVANGSTVTQDSEIYHYLDTVYTNTISSNDVILNDKAVWNIDLYEGDISKLASTKDINTSTSKTGLINYEEFKNASSNSNCKLDNWLIIDKPYWTINGIKSSNSKVLVINSNGDLSANNASEESGVRPVIYINYNIKLTGQGTKEKPYIIR